MAFLVAMSGLGKGIVGVPSSRTDVLPKALEAEFDIKRRIFIQLEEFLHFLTDIQYLVSLLCDSTKF